MVTASGFTPGLHFQTDVPNSTLYCSYFNGGGTGLIVSKSSRATASGWLTVAGRYFAISLTLSNSNFGSRIQCTVGMSDAPNTVGVAGSAFTFLFPKVDQWHHVGCTFSYSAASRPILVYADGVESTTNVVVPDGTAFNWGASGPWMVGGNSMYDADCGFAGMIQEVRVANVVRSRSWFQDTYRAGVGIPTAAQAP
jgi:hypothetical protein